MYKYNVFYFRVHRDCHYGMLLKIFGRDVLKAKKMMYHFNLHQSEGKFTQMKDDEYEEALGRLKEFGKHQKGRDHKEVKRLMELTKLRRHAWIRED